MILKNTHKKLLSLFLITALFVSLFNISIFAENILSLDGLIISDNNNLQFLAVDGTIYNAQIEDEDIVQFCNIIANSGIKINVTAKTTTNINTINIIGLTTAKDLPANLQEQWDSYKIDTHGKYSELQGRITKTDNNIYSFVTSDTIYTPMSFEFEDVQYFSEIVANTGILVNIESAVYNNNSILVSYISSVEELPEAEKNLWETYVENEFAKRTKTGVIVSHGTDQYLFVENETNKIYYLTTNEELVYFTVPIIADRGIQVSIIVTEYNENTLLITGISTNNLPEDIINEIKAADKSRFESKLFYINGYITFDGTDYNVIYNDNQILGVESNVEDVVKVIKAVANDETVKLKLEGFINYEQTVMDVRTITFLVDINNEETLQKLEEAFPGAKSNSTDTTSFATGTSTNNIPTQQTNNQTTNTSLFGTNFNESFNNLFNSINANNTTSLFNNFYNNSGFNDMYNSLFSESGLNNNSTTSSFSSLFGDTTFSGMDDLFASFNARMQSQSSLLNGSNFSNFNFEDFQSAFNSLSSMMNQ